MSDFKFFALVFGGFFLGLGVVGSMLPADPAKVAAAQVETARKAAEEIEWRKDPCHNMNLPRGEQCLGHDAEPLTIVIKVQ